MTTDAHTTTFSTPTSTQIVATRTFDASRELVFAAHTDPLHVRHWMTGPDGWTMPTCEIDLREGGTWRFVWIKDDGSEMEMTGTYLTVDPPARLVTSESWGPEWPSTTNTVDLIEEGGRTTLTYTIEFVSEEARNLALATGMTSGMTISYLRLEGHLGSKA